MVVIPRCSLWGCQAPSVFSSLLALPVGAIGATRWLATRLSTGFRPGLLCLHGQRPCPYIPTTARYCRCRLDAIPGEDTGLAQLDRGYFYQS